ncbi:MAG TPA: LamG-like jellyroll fold domain-containing protein [Puia sp.]|nr:LamG-like jellyroll fold domain-containing protein [Puia sp.]
MDGDVNDHKGGVAGTGVNVTYVTGVRGQAYQGSATSYASFTPSSAMAGLKSFSLSAWYWQVAQPANTPSNDPEGIFFLADAGGADPEIILENEHYAPVSGDSLEIHAGLTFTAATNYKGFTMNTYDTAAIGKWVHFCMTYNGGTSTYIVYQDGQPMLNQSAYGTLTSTILLDGPTGSNPQGNINWAANPPVEGTIGTWAPGVYGVSPTLGSNGNWQGKLDEIRLFNIALTPKDVAGLYLNGQAGR